MKKLNINHLNIFIVCMLTTSLPTQADVLCKVKKGGALIVRPTTCTKKETKVSQIGISGSGAALAVQGTSSNSAAETSVGTDLSVEDSGAVSGGSDINTGLDLSVSRTGASGGTINNTGLNVAVSSDGGGDSTNVGLSVQTSGADTNYCAIFQGGNVGMGVSDPDEQLEINGRIHLGQTSAPDTTSDKLYNVGGSLYWSGQALALGSVGVGTITGVTASTGLSGGGTSGNVSLSVDTGTSASKIVQLNSSAELPAVSGVNLTNINATNLASGTVSDARLSGNVSLLGSLVGLSSEVTGTLPVANGGTGASALTDLITLTTHTTGNYVASVANGSGISGGASGTEAAALTLSVDQTFSPTWTGTHSFQSSMNVGTTTASAEALHLNGRLHLEQTSAPATTTNKLYNVGGELFFNGLNISSNATGGDITAVTASTGLTGGGTTGAVTLAVDTGTTANKIVQLNSSSELPAVSGANLTALNASNLAAGTLPSARLPGTVSQLGSLIDLTSEVTGTLPVVNGGTGASSFVDLLTLGTHTTGNYVAAVAASTGITLASSGAEGGTATLSVNQAFTPSWTGTHTFSGVTTDITTGTNENFSIVPNGTGKVGIGTTSPSALIDAVLTSVGASGAVETGLELNVTDTVALSSGTDTTVGLDLNLTRSGALTGSTINSTGLDINVTGDTGGTSNTTGLNVAVSGADVNYAAIFSGGNVGIGNSSPTALLDTQLSSTATTGAIERGARIVVSDTGVVSATTDTTYGLDVNATRTGATGGTIATTALNVTGTGDSGGTSSLVGLAVAVSGADTNIAATFTGGSIGLGDTVAVTSSNVPSGSMVVGNGTLCVDDGGTNCDDGGSARVAGTIYAVSTSVLAVDVAEEFPIEHKDIVEPGDLVMANSHRGTKCLDAEWSEDAAVTCKETVSAYLPFVSKAAPGVQGNRRLLGVVSTAPGVTLGGFGREDLALYRKVPVALAGRVPVKVSLENGPIEVGDRIGLSKIAGVGARVDDDAPSVGIALEPFGMDEATDPQSEKTQGMVLVFVK